jgi:hypothetical protein
MSKSRDTSCQKFASCSPVQIESDQAAFCFVQQPPIISTSRPTGSALRRQ